MKEKIALIIIFNHRFDRNIPILEDLLIDKWSHIFHIVPFYDGCKENVIPVYENSYYYEGYLAQAYQTLKKYDFDHYVVIGDDMVLNPKLNERNILTELELGKTDSYFPVIQDLQNGTWDNISYGATFRLVQKGAEISRILPPVEEARKIIAAKGYCPTPSISSYTALKNLKGCHICDVHSFVKYCKKIIRHPFGKIEFEYPFVGGISDFFVIDAASMEKFAHYCGAFAAVNLFIEVAVPTAMLLSCSKVITQKEGCKYKEMYLWGNDINAFADKYVCSYQKLIDEYPKETLFVHPIKLSKWK